MQLAMSIGFVTGCPIGWWLVSGGIEENKIRPAV